MGLFSSEDNDGDPAATEESTTRSFRLGAAATELPGRTILGLEITASNV